MVNDPNFAGSVLSAVFSRRFVWGLVGAVAGLFVFTFTAGVLLGRTF